MRNYINSTSKTSLDEMRIGRADREIILEMSFYPYPQSVRMHHPTFYTGGSFIKYYSGMSVLKLIVTKSRRIDALCCADVMSQGNALNLFNNNPNRALKSKAIEEVEDTMRTLHSRIQDNRRIYKL